VPFLQSKLHVTVLYTTQETTTERLKGHYRNDWNWIWVDPVPKWCIKWIWIKINPRPQVLVFIYSYTLMSRRRGRWMPTDTRTSTTHHELLKDKMPYFDVIEFSVMQRPRWEGEKLYRWPGRYSTKGGITDGKINNTNQEIWFSTVKKF
jgi:hypothetical protein